MLQVVGRHWRYVLFGCVSLVCAAAINPTQGQAPSATEPQYAANGDLLFPQGFETWMFVGSNLGLVYLPDVNKMTAAEAARASSQVFHNIYLAPAAYSYFLANNVFPDKTILVMERFEARDKSEPRNVLAAGVYNGRRLGVEVAVKNSKRPDGSSTPWAYYDFTSATGVAASASAQPDDVCETCHRHNAQTDHVWVQFYPHLRDKK
jgi:hypothetical protein